MLLSLSLILILGMFMGWICRKMKLPAFFELLGMILLAPKLMGLSVLESAVMGAVLAAVSPAVVVPRMVKLMDEGYGVKEGIPQLILAGASVDDHICRNDAGGRRFYT